MLLSEIVVLHLLQPMPSDASAINLVVNCTARKTSKIGEVAARCVRRARMDKRMTAWIKALESSEAESMSANDLYCGDSWTAIRSVTEKSCRHQEVNLWIASAGFGLIRREESIVPYSATFTRGHEDSVVEEDDASSAPQAWWDGLCAWKRAKQRQPSSIQRLASMFPKQPLLIALSAEYFVALEADMLRAREALVDPDHLIIVCVGGKKDGPLAGNFLPCDARLEHVLGGARNSLNARVVRRILETTRRENLRISRLKPVFERLLHRQPPPRYIERERLGDEQVIEFITNSLLDSPAWTHSALLRALRDSGLACEQKRFRDLFREVQRTILSQS